jgi:hypothetical protein
MAQNLELAGLQVGVNDVCRVSQFETMIRDFSKELFASAHKRSFLCTSHFFLRYIFVASSHVHFEMMLRIVTL